MIDMLAELGGEVGEFREGGEFVCVLESLGCVSGGP